MKNTILNHSQHLSDYTLLMDIDSPEDLRSLAKYQLPQLAAELRHYLMATLNQVGGHFSATLGCIELTIALHYLFNTPTCPIIWDVGHQALAHKILTMRRDRLQTLHQMGGLAPFPQRSESPYDNFGTGHAGTAISAALGMAIAMQQQQQSDPAIAVVGDAAMANGLSFEALNHAGRSSANLLVILNDNGMSISPSVGAFNHFLSQSTSKKVKVGTLFHDLGLNYVGPIDGHEFPALLNQLRILGKTQGPRILHIQTIKGKGYSPAEQDPVNYHAVKPKFLVKKKTSKQAKTNTPLSYSEVFGQWICDVATIDQQVIAITPAMCKGSDLVEFAKLFPARYIDVGIAEAHSLTLAAGLACQGLKPVVAIYSTFLQRAYDQLIHDIALQNLSVLFAIDRAGLVGHDGPTHHGNFDLSFLRSIPNLVIMAASDENECYQMLTAGLNYPGPCAVRYPRGSGPGMPISKPAQLLGLGKANIIRQGQRLALLAFGSMLAPAISAAQQLDATVVNMRFIKPLDQELIKKLSQTHEWLITIEENSILGGAGSGINEIVAQDNLSVKLLNLGLPDVFVPPGNVATLHHDYQLDGPGIVKSIQQHITKVEP